MRTFEIPAPYLRILDQLQKEAKHGQSDMGHEAQRCAVYAEETLDAFGKELTTTKDIDPTTFRSKVLNPVLQRQLHGVPSHYTPAVCRAIARGDGPVTIETATIFYLANDPISPTMIPSYRRNCIYIPEVRWHLGILMGTGALGNPKQYILIRENQDEIMGELRSEKPWTGSGVPPFNYVEVETIHCERIAPFFKQELERVVGHLSDCIYGR